MSKSSSGSGFSFSTIIMLIIAYNIFFDSDDEKKVEAVEDNKPAIEQPAPSFLPGQIKKEIENVVDDAKEALSEVREDLKKNLGEGKKQIGEAKKDFDDVVNQLKQKKETPSVEVVEKEMPQLETTEEKQKPTGMQKL